jgi:hypothetical protein
MEQTTPTNVQENDIKLIEHLMKARKELPREKLVELVKLARASGGSLVGYEPGDELCPRWRFPFPPKKQFFDEFLKAGLRYNIEMFPYGIPVIDDLHVVIRGIERSF